MIGKQINISGWNMEGKGLPPSNPVIRKIYFLMLGHEVKMSHLNAMFAMR